MAVYNQPDVGSVLRHTKNKDSFPCKTSSTKSPP